MYLFLEYFKWYAPLDFSGQPKVPLDWNFFKLFLCGAQICVLETLFWFPDPHFLCLFIFIFPSFLSPFIFPFFHPSFKNVPSVGHLMSLIFFYMKLKYWRPIFTTPPASPLKSKLLDLFCVSNHKLLLILSSKSKLPVVPTLHTCHSLGKYSFQSEQHIM